MLKGLINIVYIASIAALLAVAIILIGIFCGGFTWLLYLLGATIILGLVLLGVILLADKKRKNENHHP